MRLSNLTRLLRRQDGIALVMAIGILGVLTITGRRSSTTRTRTRGAPSTPRTTPRAYDLAEAGINEMTGILNNPGNNALNQYLLPSTTHTYDGGTVQWTGTLAQSVTGASTWSLTSVGRVKNPTGASANPVTRTLTAKVPVVPTYTQPLNNPSWNFIYSRATGSTCDMTIQQSVVVKSPLYVAGNLCLENTASITAGPLIVHGSLAMAQSANFAGTASVPLNQLRVKNGCKWKNNAAHNPCQQGAGASGFDNVYATLLDNAPAVSAPPSVDWDAWYLNSNPGPYYGCLQSSGTPPSFDNDQGLATAPNPAKRNNSLTTVQRPDPCFVVHLQGLGRRALLERLHEGADGERHDVHRRQREGRERLCEHVHRLGHDVRLRHLPHEELEALPGDDRVRRLVDVHDGELGSGRADVLHRRRWQRLGRVPAEPGRGRQ